MIELVDLNKVFQTRNGPVHGVKEVNLKIEAGEIFGIVGYSGAGKSTLLRCINLLETPTSGEVIVADQKLLNLREVDLRKARQSIGMIFQGFHLVSSKTAAENIAFSLKVAGIPKADRKSRVDELLELVGLSDKGDHYPAQLSGGQKQRVSIARALANNPKVLLSDEATSALDPSTTKAILELLKKINRELGVTIVLITHEMEVVKEICHRCAVMEDGEVIEVGQTYDIFSHPKAALTQQFIQTVLEFKIPEKLLKACQGTVLRLQFQGGLAYESVVSDMLKQFNVTGNILHGKVEYIGEAALGIFIMEILGEKAECRRVVAYLEERLLEVEVVQDGNH